MTKTKRDVVRLGCQNRLRDCGAAPQRLRKPVGFLLWNLAPTIARQAATLVLIAEPERGQSRARVDLQSGIVNYNRFVRIYLVIFYLIYNPYYFQLSDSAEPGRSHGGHF